MVLHMPFLYLFIYLFSVISVFRRKSDQEVYSSEHFKGIFGCILKTECGAMEESCFKLLMQTVSIV